MNRERWIVSVITVFVLWLPGALILVPSLEKDLENATRRLLESQPQLSGRLGRVSIDFDGQVAHLHGEVRSAQDRVVIEEATRDLVQVPTTFATGISRRLNPVASIRNEIELVPYPPGWLLLAAEGTKAHLIGAAASEFEARDLALSVQDRWSAQGGFLHGQPRIDAHLHDEAVEVTATLRGVPSPQPFAQVHVTKIGGAWRSLALDKSDTALRAEAQALDISEAEWQGEILPILAAMRDKLARQRTAATEAQRLAALPAGHVFLATRSGEVLMRGEVGTHAVKYALLDEAMEVFAPRQIRDEIRVSDQRRPADDFAPVTTALIPPDKDAVGKSLFLGFGGEAWKAIDWEVGDTARPWHKEVPPGVKLEPLLGDSMKTIQWLQGATTPSTKPTPAFIVLAVCGDKAILSGLVAEEATRSQFIAAVRRASTQGRIVLHDDLRLSAASRSWVGVLDAVKSLPPLPSRGAALVLATSQSSWIELPITPDLLEAGGIGRSGLLPVDLSPALVESHSAEAIEQLRAWTASNPATQLR